MASKLAAGFGVLLAAALLARSAESIAVLGPPGDLDAGSGAGHAPPDVTLCHRAPGSPSVARTIVVGPASVPQHLAHGDLPGECGEAECGNGTLEPGEDCDDGNPNPADGCDNACNATEWIATTVVGSEKILAVSFGLGRPEGVAVDGMGRVYIADSFNHRVERVDGAVLTRIAGTGVPGAAGDGIPATAAQLLYPSGVALDRHGRLYIAEGSNNCVRRVDASGIIRVIAGTCGLGYSLFIPGTNNTGDGGPALQATFAGPVSVAVDSIDRVYISDYLNNVVRRIDENGIIERVAGTGRLGLSGDLGDATDADLARPVGLAVDAAGALYIADHGNSAIRKIDHPGPPSAPGTIHTVAGILGQPFPNPPQSDPDGPVETTTLVFPEAVFVDGRGVMTIAETGIHRIRQVIGGNVVTVAGDPQGCTWGFAGDGGPAASACLSFPAGVAVDGFGRIILADTFNHRVRRIEADPARTIFTIAGTGAPRVTGEGQAATSARIYQPLGVAADAGGNVYFSDGYDQVAGEAGARLRRVDPQGTVTTIGGNGNEFDSPILYPERVAVDSIGRVYVVETGYAIVWRADPGGLVRIAGGGTSTAEGTLATDAALDGLSGIAFDAMDRLYVSLSGYSETVRRIDHPGGVTGTIVTVAGGGSETGDTTGPDALLRAQLDFPRGLAFDASGRLYIAEGGGRRIARVDFDEPSLTRVAGGRGNTQTGENVPPLLARMVPIDVAVDRAGNIYYLDPTEHRVRRIDAGLTGVTTVAGSRARQLGDHGDGGPSTGSQDEARLFVPQAIALDSDGRLLIADAHNHRVRRVADDGTITTVAGFVDPESMGPAGPARLADPVGLAGLPGMTLIAGGVSGTVQMFRDGFVHAAVGRYGQSRPTEDLARFRDRTFGEVGGIAADMPSLTLYVAESHRIHRVAMTDPGEIETWTIEPLANVSGTPGYADGDAALAMFRSPHGMFHDGTALYVADTQNHAIRMFDGSLVGTIAGRGGQRGFAGDGGPASEALLDGPEAVTACGNGDLFVADTGNNRVRRIHLGTISTVLGTGAADSSGEGAPASSYPVDRPEGLECDAAGNLYVTSTSTVRQLAAADGVVDGTGPVRTIYGSTEHACLTGVTRVDEETLRVADRCLGEMIELHRQPVRSTGSSRAAGDW